MRKKVSIVIYTLVLALPFIALIVLLLHHNDASASDMLSIIDLFSVDLFYNVLVNIFESTSSGLDIVLKIISYELTCLTFIVSIEFIFMLINAINNRKGGF